MAWWCKIQAIRSHCIDCAGIMDPWFPSISLWTAYTIKMSRIGRKCKYIFAFPRYNSGQKHRQGSLSQSWVVEMTLSWSSCDVGGKQLSVQTWHVKAYLGGKFAWPYGWLCMTMVSNGEAVNVITSKPGCPQYSIIWPIRPLIPGLPDPADCYLLSSSWTSVPLGTPLGVNHDYGDILEIAATHGKILAERPTLFN